MPFSKKFQDIYYSKDDGLAEARFVFIEQNKISEKLQSLKDRERALVIGELGFGTGLNFLATWDLWSKLPVDQRRDCHFISCEKFPLSLDEIKIAHSEWPELAELSAEFCKSYQILPQGIHRLLFAGGKMSLNLLIGDALNLLSQLKGKIDCWYLDGFSPPKNPELWSSELFKELARLSKNQTSFATYSSAGSVKRNLQSAGFTVEKFSGFGRKRESLKGLILKPSLASAKNNLRTRTAMIIGGGFAGIASAETLSRRGYKVRILEQNAQMASAASGHSAAIQFPILMADLSPLSLFSFTAFLYQQDWLKNFKQSLNYQKSGCLKLISDPLKIPKYLQSIQDLQIPSSILRLVDEVEASRLSGFSQTSPAQYFETAASLNLQSLCRNILTKYSQAMDIRSSAKVVSLKPTASDWSALDANGNIIATADVCVLAQAHSLTDLKVLGSQRLYPLPLRKVRGQLAYIRCPELSLLKTILCGQGFLTPLLKDGSQCLGATYQNEDADFQIRESDTQILLNRLQELFPQVNLARLEAVSSWAQIRTSLPGQSPVMGSMIANDGKKIPGLYILSGLVSRGSIYAPLLAEALASKIENQISPLTTALENFLAPEHFFNKC